MKLPEIPGTTRAEIAIAPDINIYKPVTLSKVAEGENSITEHKPVSYTHLTLPTIYSV